MPPRKRKDNGDTGAVEKKRRKRKDGATNGSHVAEMEESPDEKVLHGSMITGELLFSGGTNWDLVGRHSVPKGVKNLGGRNLWGPHRIKTLCGVRLRTIVSGCNACHSVVITEEGKAYSWGRNDKAQLGHGDTLRRDVPTLIESLVGLNIVDAACGKSHTLLISDRGHVYGVGDNKMGQLGLGSQSASVPSPTRISYKGPPICKVSAGGEFSMAVDVRGNMYSFGCPEYGQLGHNTDGKYFVTSSKLTYNCESRPRKVSVFMEKGRDGHITPLHDVEVDEVACGMNHTICLDRKKRVYTWGFGGYGRLGHTDQKDQWVPRLLTFFTGPNRGATSIQAGSTFSMAINGLSVLLLWGKNKQTGDSAMYPKPVQDLSGWTVRQIGCCNRSIVLLADDSVVSWGCSPTFGELGLGENRAKSSTTALEVKPLESTYIQKLACGFAHSLFLARVDTEADRKKVGRLPIYNPETLTTEDADPDTVVRALAPPPVVAPPPQESAEPAEAAGAPTQAPTAPGDAPMEGSAVPGKETALVQDSASPKKDAAAGKEAKAASQSAEQESGDEDNSSTPDSSVPDQTEAADDKSCVESDAGSNSGLPNGASPVPSPVSSEDAGDLQPPQAAAACMKPQADVPGAVVCGSMA